MSVSDTASPERVARLAARAPIVSCASIVVAGERLLPAQTRPPALAPSLWLRYGPSPAARGGSRLTGQSGS